MSDGAIKVRLMKPSDLEAIVKIDERVLKVPRRDYYCMKFERNFEHRDTLPASLVAEDEEGNVVGFVMGHIYMGEYGIFQEEATLDTMGVDPDYQGLGIGGKLINEFFAHLKTLGVQKIYTLVGWDDAQLVRFFSANDFIPSRTINLERTL